MATPTNMQYLDALDRSKLNEAQKGFISACEKWDGRFEKPIYGERFKHKTETEWVQVQSMDFQLFLIEARMRPWREKNKQEAEWLKSPLIAFAKDEIKDWIEKTAESGSVRKGDVIRWLRREANELEKTLSLIDLS